MKLYYCTNTDAFDWETYIAELPESRRNKALRYRREIDRRLCVASYVMLCHALKTSYGIDGQLRFTYGEYGKPYLADYPNVFFNLSHCEAGVACAVSDFEVGADIQEVKPYAEAVANRVFCGGELDELNRTQDKNLEFARLWTRKEAYLKMLGAGISDGMKLIDTAAVSDILTFDIDRCVVSVSGREFDEIIRMYIER